MRMTCVECGPELAARANDELDAATRDAVDAHLAACEHCRAEYAGELALKSSLGALPVAACPDVVSARVLAAVARDEAAARRRRQARWGGAGVTLAAAATVAAVLLLRPGLRPGGDASAPGETPVATVGRGAPVAASGTGAPVAATAPVLAPDGSPYTAEQIAAARRDLIQTMTLTANLLDRAGRRTLSDVFSTRLPAAVAGSLRPLDDTTRGG